MIEYVDSRGVPGSFAESIILDSATEYLSSVMCAYCGARRHKSDCTVQTVSTYMSTSQKHFCTDKGCAESSSARTFPRQDNHGERDGDSANRIADGCHALPAV